VVGVLELLLVAGQHEASLHRHHRRHALHAQRFGQPHTAVLAPQRLRTEQVAEVAEGVEVVLAHLQPVAEADTQLVGAVRGAQELALVDADQLVVVTDGREGGFAHTDDADVLGLDHLDGGAALQSGDQRRGHHPAGAATAHDNDAINFLRHRDPAIPWRLERTAPTSICSISGQARRQPTQVGMPPGQRVRTACR
jgi:hypothetical protein